jgi:flagellar biosynthesis/type III secretory pathway protein FliH
MSEIIRTPSISSVTRELHVPEGHLRSENGRKPVLTPQAQKRPDSNRDNSEFEEAGVTSFPFELPISGKDNGGPGTGEEDPPPVRVAEDLKQSLMPEPVLTPSQVREAHAEALRQLEEEATLEGYRKGYSSGQEEAARDYEQLLKQLGHLLDSLAEERQSCLALSEDDMVEVVFAAVCKIIGQSMSTDAGAVAAVRQTMAEVMQSNPLVVRVCPDDYELLKESEELLGQKLQHGTSLVPDGRVMMGGCLLETPSGTLDGRLDVQLQKLREVLLHVRSQRRLDEHEGLV